MKPPRARLRIHSRPDLAPGAIRYEVDCWYSTTGLTHLPSPVLPMTDEMLILAAGYAHEQRCGQYDVSDVLSRGDQQSRELTERMWAELQGAMLMRGRRN